MSGRSRSPSESPPLLIGATGTFSPCGLSVIDTIGPTGHTGGRRTTIAACIAFLPGAIAGGLLTFGSLAVAGRPAARRGRAGRLPGRGGDRAVRRRPRGQGHPDRAADPPAAARALAAGDADAGRRRPLRRAPRDRLHDLRPLASGSGPSPGSASRSAIPPSGWCSAPASGWAARFRSSRSRRSPAARPASGRTELMCERPGVYLGLRRGDAAALAVAALALIVVPGSASAAGTSIAHATDPSATADSLLFQRLGGPRGDEPRGTRDPAPRQPSGDRRPLCRHRPGRRHPPLRSQHPGAGRADPRAGRRRDRGSPMPGLPIGRPPEAARASSSAISRTRRLPPRPSSSPRRAAPGS